MRGCTDELCDEVSVMLQYYMNKGCCSAVAANRPWWWGGGGGGGGNQFLENSFNLKFLKLHLQHFHSLRDKGKTGADEHIDFCSNNILTDEQIKIIWVTVRNK